MTVRMTLELTVKVAVVAAVFANVIELIVAFAVTVMESPGRMITSSVDAGTVPLGQGAFAVVEFQLPLPAVVIVAADPVVAQAKLNRSASRGRALDHFIKFLGCPNRVMD